MIVETKIMVKVVAVATKRKEEVIIVLLKAKDKSQFALKRISQNNSNLLNNSNLNKSNSLSKSNNRSKDNSSLNRSNNSLLNSSSLSRNSNKDNHNNSQIKGVNVISLSNAQEMSVETTIAHNKIKARKVNLKATISLNKMIDLIEKRMRTNLKFILSFFIVCVLTSCTGNTMYYSYSPTPSDGWEKDDTIYFHIPIREGGEKWEK